MYALQVRFVVRQRCAGRFLGSVCALQVNFLGSIYALHVKFRVYLRYAGRIWECVFAIQVKFGVCLRYAGEILGLSRLYR